MNGIPNSVNNALASSSVLAVVMIEIFIPNTASISSFKLREGMPVGAMVTLRGQRMYDFLQKLNCVVLPRIRDFRGVSSKSFDGRGNYTLGLKEQALFPEISYDEVDVVQGMNISIITTANTDEEGRALLAELGVPFKK